MPAPASIRSPVVNGWTVLCGLAILAQPARAEQLRPVVGPGATRDQVIEAYGWPSGQSQSAGKEIFTYPQGRVVLQQGIVERMDFSPTATWAKPKPRPAPATAVAPAAAKAGAATPAKPAPPLVDPWLTDYAAALAQARTRGAQVLALFTGTDWSPLARKFQTEVALHPAFIAAMSPDFVLLKLDFPTHAALSPELRQQNLGLRDRFAVTAYPTLILLSGTGAELSRVNLAKTRTEPTYRDQVIAAIHEAQPVPTAMAKAIDARTSAASSARPPGSGGISRWVLGSAVVLLAYCWYRLRRRAAAAELEAPEPSRLPSPAEIAAWPTAKLRGVSAALFASEGWRVQARPVDSGVALALGRGSDGRAQVLVQCQPAADGLASGHAIRDLFASTVAEGVETAWFVSPGGFTAESRQFASEHQLKLIAGEELIERLKAVPPLALVRILAA